MNFEKVTGWLMIIAFILNLNHDTQHTAGNLPCNDQGKKEDRLLTARQERLSVEMTTKVSANVFTCFCCQVCQEVVHQNHYAILYPCFNCQVVCLKGLRRWPLMTLQLCSVGLVAVASCGGWFLPFAGKIIPTTVVFTVLHVESYIETRNLMYLFDLSIV